VGKKKDQGGGEGFAGIAAIFKQLVSVQDWKRSGEEEEIEKVFFLAAAHQEEKMDRRPKRAKRERGGQVTRQVTYSPPGGGKRDRSGESFSI